MKKLNPEKYRFECGSVFEFDDQENAYFFIGKLNGRTKSQFINDYESENLPQYPEYLY